MSAIEQLAENDPAEDRSAVVVPIRETAETATAETVDGEATAQAPIRDRARAPARARVRPAVSRPPFWRRAVAYFQPPELWSERRPSLAEVWSYARHGEWTSATGVWRLLGGLYAVAVAFPAHLLGYGVLFLIERPGRLIALGLVAFLVGLTPPGGLGLDAIATGLRAVADLAAWINHLTP